MDQELIIRPATSGDLAEIAALEDVLHTYKVDPSRQWQHFENNPDRAVLLATIQGKVAGMVKVNTIYKLSKVMVMLDELVVHDDYRGQRIGTKLMQAAEEWAWEHGADLIDFTSRESHNALGFYEKLGYEKRDTAVYRKLREGYNGSR